VNLTLRATGWRAFLLLAAAIAALFVLPRALSAPPARAEMEEAIRAAWGREAWAERSDATQEEIGRAFIAVSSRKVTDMTIRRSLVGPPFAYRWAYFVEARIEPDGGVEYYRFSRGLATRTSPFWWRLRLF
jgi:hypothetical protein